MRITKYNLELENQIPHLVKEESRNYNLTFSNSPLFFANVAREAFRLHKQAEERAILCCCNTAGKIIGVFELSHGTVQSSFVSNREIAIRALLCGATGLVLLHNHPSGNPVPSQEDIDITCEVKQGMKMLGLQLIDHIIVGNEVEGNSFYHSFAECKQM